MAVIVPGREQNGQAAGEAVYDRGGGKLSWAVGRAETGSQRRPAGSQNHLGRAYYAQYLACLPPMAGLILWVKFRAERRGIEDFTLKALSLRGNESPASPDFNRPKGRGIKPQGNEISECPIMKYTRKNGIAIRV
jgi:hypothetical protein